MNGLEEARSTTAWSTIAYWLLFGVGLVWTAQMCLRFRHTATADKTVAR
jgi:hypothetical protein